MQEVPPAILAGNPNTPLKKVQSNQIENQEGRHQPVDLIAISKTRHPPVTEQTFYSGTHRI